MKTTSRLLQIIIFSTIIILLSACKQKDEPVAETVVAPVTPDPTIEIAESVSTVADRYYATALREHPEIAYFSGVELPRHDGMENNSPSARQALEAREDEMLEELESIDISTLKGRSEWITHAY